jgi:hypothetical protein
MENMTEHERLECPKCGATWEDDIEEGQVVLCGNPVCRQRLVILEQDGYLVAMEAKIRGAA